MNQLEKAIENLGMIRLIKLDKREIRLMILLKKEDWKNLAAPWWKGKSASVVGADIDGNFLLSKSSGEFVLWVHSLQEEFYISNKLGEMLAMLEMDTTNVP